MITKAPLAYCKIGKVPGELTYEKCSEAFELVLFLFGLYNATTSMSKSRGLGNTGISHSVGVAIISHGDRLTLQKDVFSGQVHREIDIHFLHNVQAKTKCLCRVKFSNCLVLMSQTLSGPTVNFCHINIGRLATIVEDIACDHANATALFSALLDEDTELFASKAKRSDSSSCGAGDVDYTFLVFNYNEADVEYFHYKNNEQKGKFTANVSDPANRR